MLSRSVFDDAAQRARALHGAHRSPSPDGLDAFFGVVSHLADDEFSAAFAATLRASEYYPTPASVLRHHEQITEAAYGRAWDLVLQTAQRNGRYYTPQFPPKVAGALRAVGGWVALCLCDTAALATMRTHFLAAMRTGVEDHRPLDSVFGLPSPHTTTTLALPAPESK